MSKKCIAPPTLAAIALIAVACSQDGGPMHGLGELASFAPPSGFQRVPYKVRGPGSRGAVFENARNDLAESIRIEILPFAATDEQGCARSHQDLMPQVSSAANSPRRGTVAGRQAIVTDSSMYAFRPATGRRPRLLERSTFFVDENSVMKVSLSAGSEESLQEMKSSLTSLELRVGPLDDEDLVPGDAREAVAWFASPRPARRIVGEACIPTFGADSIEPIARALREGKLDPLVMNVWPLLARIGEPAVEALIELLDSDSEIVRSEAIKALGEIGDERAVGPLIDTLDSNPGTGPAAALALGKLRAAEAVLPLIETLSSTESAHRAAAAEALGSIGDRRALPELLRVARSDAGAARKQAIRALGGVGGREVLDVLAEYLGGDDENLRGDAIVALGSIRDPEAIRLLCITAGHDSPVTRANATQWLVQTEFAAARAPLLDCLGSDHGAAKAAAARALGRMRAEVSDSLALLLADGRMPVRTAAFAALSRIGDARAIELMWEALVQGDSLAEGALAATGASAIPTLGAGLEHGDVATRRAAVTVLAAIDETAATEYLLSALADPDESVGRIAETRLAQQRGLDVGPLVQLLREGAGPSRRRAARLLGSAGKAETVEPLLEAIDDSDPLVRRNAVRALGQIRDPRAAEELLALLAHEELSSFAVRALSRLRPPVVAQIAARLETGTSVERTLAIRVLELLAEIDDPPALIDPLIAAMNDEADMIRATAASAAGALGDPAAVESLGGLLKDPVPFVRTKAVEALGRLRASPSVDRLIVLAADPDESLRRAAVGALGQVRDARAVEGLIGALSDRSVAVRLLAIEGLWKAQDHSAVPPLVDALSDPEARIRRVAAEALGRIGDTSALLPLLAALADDADGEVRARAATALGLIGDPAAIDPLEAATKAGNPQVQRAARWALVQLTGAFETWMAVAAKRFGSTGLP